MLIWLVHTRMHTRTHTHARTHTHMHTHTHTHARTHTYTHTHTHTHTHALAHTHACTHARTHAHTHICTHTCIHAHTHTRTHMHTRTHTVTCTALLLLSHYLSFQHFATVWHPFQEVREVEVETQASNLWRRLNYVEYELFASPDSRCLGFSFSVCGWFPLPFSFLFLLTILCSRPQRQVITCTTPVPPFLSPQLCAMCSRSCTKNFLVLGLDGGRRPRRSGFLALVDIMANKIGSVTPSRSSKSS